jgi:hypothetical protein
MNNNLIKSRKTIVMGLGEVNWDRKRGSKEAIYIMLAASITKQKECDACCVVCY